MGRGHLIRLAILAAATALGVPAALAAGAPPHFVLVGTTTPGAQQSPNAYLAATRAQESRWLGRIAARDRGRVTGVDFRTRVVVAGFLDGSPCLSHVALQRWKQVGSRLVVMVRFTRPPIGMATCVRTSVSYIVLSLDRSAFPVLPSSVELRGSARS